MQAEVWDKKYGQEVFQYGTDPNVFIAEVAQKYLTTPSSILELCSGEGRNVVHLAKAGHTVYGVDFSEEGLKKTNALAQRHGCSERVTTYCADVTTWVPPQGPGSIDAVVMSFCHIPQPLKQQMFDNFISALKPGGLLLLETFRPDQVSRGWRETSGGPHDPNMMFTLEELRGLTAGRGQELEGAEVDYELHEGPLHQGMAAVVRYVWRKSG